jgi:uncharacterized membrane protein YbhN (UPF0104 family)
MPTLPRWLETTLKAVLAVGAMGYLVVVVEWAEIVETVRRAEWQWVMAAAVLLPANLALDAWVWGVFLRPVMGRLSLGTLLSAVMSGFAVGFFTPARVGEYVGRAFHLDLEAGETDGWTVSATIFAQRIADMAVAVDVGTAAVAATMGLGYLPASWPWLGALAAGTGVGLSLTILMIRPHWIDAVVRRFFPSADTLHRRTLFLAELTPGQLLRIFSGTGLRFGVFALQLGLLATAFAPAASPGLIALAVGCTYFAAFLIPPITLMDLGIREGAAVYFFGLLGLGEATGLNASFLIFVLNILLPSAAGVLFIRGLTFAGNRAPSPEGARRS